MSDVLKPYQMALEDIDATERAKDASEGDRIAASLRGIFEMTAAIAFQLEKLNSNLKANDS